jgi:glutamyl-tRNA(Gln) amidotransferase subunit E
MSEYDYAGLGLIAGLEIHQQLDTDAKLFCACPTELRDPEDATRRFARYLHPTASELGEIDQAALEESRVDREFEYLAYDSTCLVEEDDEPPHRLDEQALSVTLGVAQLLEMEPVDQGHVMRKIVVDGSNTTGFQRTMLVATDGVIETEHGTVGIEDIMLEEESAQRVAETDEGVRFSLDRLGIPLVEIGTRPDIESPAEARAAAERIGMLLRSTGDVKRGLGSIRQDVNVSIADGARVEIKGVQQLDDIDDIVENEVGRQVSLLEVADELQSRGAAVDEPVEVTDVFADTESGVLESALSGDGKAMAIRLGGFDGLVGREIQPDRRVGTEFADHARRHGAGGVFHTDELPAYGITQNEVDELMATVDAGPEDAVVLVADDPEMAELAIGAVAERARTALDDVPEETRGANDDGTTRYLRPLPGSARMYPETDVPPVEPDVTEVEQPELLTEKVERYRTDYALDEGLAEQVAYDRYMPVFETVVAEGVDPTLAASTLASTLTELRRDDVPVAALSDDHLIGALALVDGGDVPAEGLPDLLETLAENPELTAAEAVEEADLGGVGEEAVREAVTEIVERNVEQVEAEGMEAFSALMGECMGALRGKADGDVVSDVLREEIAKRA